MKEESTAEEIIDIIEDAITDILEAIKDKNPDVGLPDIGDLILGGASDQVDAILDGLTKMAKEGDVCHAWYASTLQAIACSSVDCVKGRPAQDSKKCGEIHTLADATLLQSCIKELPVVRAEWREVRGQRSEVRSQKSEVRSQKLETA